MDGNIMGKRMRQLRLSHGYTLDYIGKLIGVQSSAVSKYESGRVENMTRSSIKTLADLYGVKPSYLMGFEDKRVVNVYASVHAGIPCEMIENVVDTEELTHDMVDSDKQYFGLKVKGDSMFPEYRENDTIILEACSDCENGCDCVVSVNGDDAFLKRVYKNASGITLQALNPAYEPLNYTNEEVEKIPVRIIGKVIELRRRK